MRRQTVKTAMALISVIMIIVLGVYTAVDRARACYVLADDAVLAAGMLTFSNGSTATEPPARPEAVKPLSAEATEPTRASSGTVPAQHSGKQYPVVETAVNNGNMSYGNLSVRNTTSYTPDLEALLGAELPFSLEDNHTVQVLIYHTHTCESYLDEDSGVYYESFYPRSTDPSQGVIAVGDAIVEMLKARGIGAVHDTTLHDYPSYEGSYGRSWQTISDYREKYPGIKVTIDIHRDSMTSDDGTKYKPTFTYQGKKAAQIMIMTGYDEGGDFPFWDENLIFAVRLQQRCEDMYPGMTRPLNFGEFTYNMNFNNGSLLIEVGTDANTVEEAARSGEFLGNALSSVLQKG